MLFLVLFWIKTDEINDDEIVLKGSTFSLAIDIGIVNSPWHNPSKLAFLSRSITKRF